MSPQSKYPSIYRRSTWLGALQHGVGRLSSAVAIGVGSIGAQAFSDVSSMRLSAITLTGAAASGLLVGAFGYLGGLTPADETSSDEAPDGETDDGCTY